MRVYIVKREYGDGSGSEQIEIAGTDAAQKLLEWAIFKRDTDNDVNILISLHELSEASLIDSFNH